MTAFLKVEQGYVNVSHIIHIGHDSTHGGTVTVTWTGGIEAFHIKLTENSKIDNRFELAIAAEDAAHDLMIMINAVQEKEEGHQAPLIKFLASDNGNQRNAYWKATILRETKTPAIR